MMSAAIASNGTPWEVVFLMKPLGLLIVWTNKKPLPLNPDYRELHVYTTELRLVGIVLILRLHGTERGSAGLTATITSD